MPWNKSVLDPLIDQAKRVLKGHFDQDFNTPIRICTLSELAEAAINEAKADKKSNLQVKRIELLLRTRRLESPVYLGQG